jgi:RNA polymerase sigma-70 factor (ECF subfamily)
MEDKMSLELLMSHVPDGESRAGTIEIETLVRRTLAGDTAAFEGIVRKFERRVMTLCLRLLGNLPAAEDAAQETFLRVFKYMHRLDLQKPIDPWLTRIAVNVCRDQARKEQRRNTLATGSNNGEYREPLDDSANPHEGLSAEERKLALRQALQLLPEKERLALLLRDVEGLSTAEVAGTLGSSETTVRSQICRGRVRLKEALERILGGKS